MKEITLVQEFKRTILKIEVPQYYKLGFRREYYKKFDNSDCSNMYSAIPITNKSFAIKLANTLLDNGIYCEITNESIELASYRSNGNIFVMPIIDNEKYYLYFVVLN